MRITRPPDSGAFPLAGKAGGDRQERIKHRYQTDFNPASYLFALEELIIQTGITLLYDTRFCAVRREAGRISHVIVENKHGRSALACGVVIDTTGDADVCYVAGEATVAIDSNVPAAWFYTFGRSQLKRHRFTNKYCPNASRAGGKGPFFRGDDAEQVTAHIVHSRQLVREKIQRWREEHPGEDIQLLMPPTIACFRMTRRLDGRFTLGERHVHQWFDDVIGLSGDWRRPGPVYAIPMGTLCGTQNNNLLTAGRSISVDNSAWDALRAFPPCVVTGQAAGTAAALAVAQTDSDVSRIDRGLLQSKLADQGVLLDRKLVAAV